MNNYYEESIQLHKEHQGKISTKVDVPLNNKDDLSKAYTPGVAAVSLAIQKNPEKKYELTSIGKTVAVISNGTAVLGLGNIGAEAAFPVMEGKAALFKQFGGVNAHPICVNTKNSEEFIEFVKKIAINYAGINLEDIKAPECFHIEQVLDKELDIPVFHDDQHGTAIVVNAALQNALKLADKQLKDVKIVINGAGSAGMAIALLLSIQGPKELLVVDSKGILTNDRSYSEMEFYKKHIAKENKHNTTGSLSDAIKGADIFIGVSKPNVLRKEDVQNMNKKAIIFALSNPLPEIEPQVAKDAGAFIVATGRSDYPNQINNVLAFPGIFAGALQSKATTITTAMKLKAAQTIAENTSTISVDNILPSPLDASIHKKVRDAVAQEWRNSQ